MGSRVLAPDLARPDRISAAHPDPGLLDDPKAVGERLDRHCRNHSRHNVQHMRLLLPPKAQHNQSEVMPGWVGADVGESGVEGNEGTLLPLT